ncbi:MAG TPA: 50S ribosomal protein L18 [Candidatus Paceibacterota bacterium]|nr:50S ribosomal protein L18 [Candidatus Paceibacterota bacterium]
MKSARHASNTRERRRARIRARVAGTSERPRLAVFKSNRYLYAQVIDDAKGVTLAHATSLPAKGGKKGSATEAATAVGAAIAKEALAKGVKQVVFDRGGFLYTGKVKLLAEAARAGGLAF